MTNKEKYKEEIFDVACQHQRCAIVRTEHFRLKFQPCSKTLCRACILNNCDDCDEEFINFLKREVK